MIERSGQFYGVATERYHAFDNLRGILMMLLLILHASVAYMVTPLGTIWPFKDLSTNVMFDITGLFIHTFRLPLLFVMAGFFGAKLYYERGTAGFLKNRLQRIAAPLIIFWVLLAPLILASFAFSRFDSGSCAFTGIISWLISVDARSYLNFFHLWFLFDILLYYGAVLLIIRLSKLLKLRWSDKSRQKLEIAFRSSWGLLIFVAITTISLLPMKLGMIETPATFARPPSTLLANFVFILFGWALYLRKYLMSYLLPRAWAYTSLGVVFYAAHLASVSLLIKGKEDFHFPSIIFASLSIWLLVYGIMGLFLRYFDKPTRVGRYIADSSYWCYLVHLPLVAWLTVLLAEWRITAILKYVIVLFITTLICLLTYDYFVRKTLIGVLLNGKKRSP